MTDERIVYVNGEFVPQSEARISVFDRAVLFADAIYEVCAVLEGKLTDTEAHFARLRRSLGELQIDLPDTDAEILGRMRELVSRNHLEGGVVYLQVSRGVAERDFLPPTGLPPTVFMFTQTIDLAGAASAESGIRVITVPEIRWGRRDIKTVALLGASLAKRAAVEAGADDAWFVEDGFVTEGTSNNVYIVTETGKLVTRPLSRAILAGCTRAAVLRLAAENGIEIEERPFTPGEAQEAAEAFLTSAGGLVTGVVSVDGRILSNGRPGPLTRRLREIYLELARATAV